MTARYLSVGNYAIEHPQICRSSLLRRFPFLAVQTTITFVFLLQACRRKKGSEARGVKLFLGTHRVLAHRMCSCGSPRRRQVADPWGHWAFRSPHTPRVVLTKHWHGTEPLQPTFTPHNTASASSKHKCGSVSRTTAVMSSTTLFLQGSADSRLHGVCYSGYSVLA